MTTWNMRRSASRSSCWATSPARAWNESAYSNPEFDAKLTEATAQPDVEKRKVLMKDLETILQDSGILIQSYWRSLYNHSATYVKNFGMHPTYEPRLPQGLARQGA